MADKDVAGAASAGMAREGKIVNQGIVVSAHMEICDVTERVVEMSHHRDDATVAAAKAQFVSPARHETIRFVAWLLSVLGGTLLFFEVGVPNELTLTALGVLGAYKLINEWKKHK